MKRYSFSSEKTADGKRGPSSHLRPLRKQLYDRLGARGRARIDRLRFALGLMPRVAPPRPKREAASGEPTLVISADLELAWGWRYDSRSINPGQASAALAQRTRENMPKLLRLFDEAQTPVTWAVVGHLLLDHCERLGGIAHPGLPRIPFFSGEHWKFTSGDWFDADPCSDWREAPEWYAPDLIRLVTASGVTHEIACHTFSHIDCSDRVCPPEVLDTELTESRRIAERWGLSLETFVFPGNLAGNFATLKRHDFLAYRWHGRYHLDVPRRDGHGLWRIPGGLCWELPAGWSPRDWVAALRRCVDKAQATGTLLHLWFHPSCEPVNLTEVFPPVLKYALQACGKKGCVTMRELAHRLSSFNGQAVSLAEQRVATAD